MVHLRAAAKIAQLVRRYARAVRGAGHTGRGPEDRAFERVADMSELSGIPFSVTQCEESVLGIRARVHVLSDGRRMIDVAEMVRYLQKLQADNPQLVGAEVSAFI